MLVAAPTGAGKTVVGEFAVHLALAEGRKCFYTTPIKALSNQKYADLVARHGADRVGLLTGDNSINGDAHVVVMTTEVLRNMLYAGSDALAGLAYVVMDEVHYLSDRFRGAVWEEVIIHLPESVRLVSLSATVSNAEEFGDWLVTVRGETAIVVEEHRPVPLWQHVMVGSRLLDLCVDDDRSAGARPGRPGRPGRQPRAAAGGQGRGAVRPARRPSTGPGAPAAAAAGGPDAVPGRRRGAAGPGRAAAGDHVRVQPGRLRRGRRAVPAVGAAAHRRRSGRRSATTSRSGAPTCPTRTWPCSATTSGWTV